MFAFLIFGEGSQVLTWPHVQGQRYVDEVKVQMHGGDDSIDIFHYPTMYD